jgi:hypothetical protein
MSTPIIATARSRARVPLAVLIALLALLLEPVAAAPMTAPGDEVKAQQVRLATRDGEPGRWGRAQVRLQGDREQRLFVRGLNVSAPLSVQVIAESTDHPVKVSLHRHAWAQAQTEGSTGNTGVYRFDGRAHGDVGVKLISTDGTAVRATVLFWQGAAVPRPLAAVYAAPGTERAVQAGMPSRGEPTGLRLLWIGVPLGAGVLAFAAWRFRRRGAPTAAGAVIVLAATAIAVPERTQAQQQPPDPFAVPEGWKPGRTAGSSQPPKDKDAPDAKPKPKPKDKDGAEPKPKDKPEDKPDGAAPPNPFEVPEGWKPSGGSASSKAPKDEDTQAPKDPADADSGAAPDGSYRERIAQAEAHARDLARQVASNRAEIERLKLLLESDRDAEPQPDRLPPMPLSCRPPTIEGDGVQRSSTADAAWAHFERCQQCYAQPLADFERQLLLYEQLRVLYGSTRDYVTRVIDLGDKLPKPHSLLENAWAAQKLSIRRSFDGTRKAYDAKLLEFNDRLSEILDRIGVCEAELNNNPMWRRTSGLFFHQTMATSYKRTD